MLLVNVLLFVYLFIVHVFFFLIIKEDTPVIEGQLKEKKSKWKIFRKWRTRYFTLSGAHLSYRGAGTVSLVS